MKTKIKNVYYCDFCKRKGMVKSVIQLHEDYCTKNPANFAMCLQGCTHLSQVDKSFDENSGGTFKTFRCGKLDIELYSLRVLEKIASPYCGDPLSFREIVVRATKMPNTCNEFSLF